MFTPRFDYVTCASPAGLHRMAYTEWGDPDNDRVLICVHGLTRHGRDFDELAQRLAGEFRVVCPDVVGRGRSDWLTTPTLYSVPQYVADMVTLIARLRPASLSWVGTSMGGLIGLSLAGVANWARMSSVMQPRVGGLPPDAQIRFDSMVLNDVGPRLDPLALGRIGQYVGQTGEFNSLDEAIRSVRQTAAPFGPMTDEQWERFTRRTYVERDGKWVKHYDLNLALPLAAQAAEVYSTGEQMLWNAYDSLDCPVLIVRGEASDLLSTATASEMLRRNPRARLVTVPLVGHAPTLMDAAQLDPVVGFLLEREPTHP
ncbi:alpha/beta fold hydrolase [Bordetella sp. 02P26C-1]|uniref:alpha/beta fold hydrolase n=1 Tax=Bordetella sp. 02P26C-1 TaxID=2683195 RepID=UPI00135472AE|nr:alpha/beta hydrolase [Bordetella sp. 02P26C-1]MVW80682.1 alpha/beta fold hydrolase [Bordetella sp. 02P26C-1]